METGISYQNLINLYLLNCTKAKRPARVDGELDPVAPRVRLSIPGRTVRAGV